MVADDIGLCWRSIWLGWFVTKMNEQIGVLKTTLTKKFDTKTIILFGAYGFMENQIWKWDTKKKNNSPKW